VQAEQTSQKRKLDDEDEEVPTAKRANSAKPPKAKSKNAIYVTGLPTDTNIDEIHAYFSKFGVIAESALKKGAKQVTYDEDGDPVVHKIGPPRINLYKNQDGTLKGDALIVFHDTESDLNTSVVRAVDFADGANFREGSNGGEAIIRVDVADSTYKKTNDIDEEARKELMHKAARAKVNPKLVVLERMFTIYELKEDPNLHDEIIEDCKEHFESVLPKSKVKKIVVYDREPSGIITVLFESAQSAKDCIQRFNGASFAGRTVTARYAEPGEKFRKGEKTEVEKEEEEKKRMEAYGNDLEGKTDGKTEANGKEVAKDAQDGKKEDSAKAVAEESTDL
jgi:HIV Tat-specific factor 1